MMLINEKELHLPASKQGRGHYLPILVKTVEQLDAMLSYDCKILVFRFDLHLYESTDDNQLMSQLIRRYRQWIGRQGHSRLGFIWCREQATGKAQHYHCAFILDANKTRHSHHHIKKIERLWMDRDYGNVYTPKNCYYVIKRDDAKSYQRAFSRLSYLAKVDTKDVRPSTTNDYSTSRIKPK